jgi:hypothetical protein
MAHSTRLAYPIRGGDVLIMVVFVRKFIDQQLLYMLMV